jgi:hypothetical protein
MNGVTGDAARAEVIAFALTLPELCLLRDHLPGLVLPAFVPAAAPDDGTGGPPAPEGVLESLRERKLVDDRATLAGPDWSERIPPTLLLALTLQMSGHLVFQVVAWSAGTGGRMSHTTHSTTVTETVCAGLTVRSVPGSDEEPQAHVTLTSVAGLYPSLVELLPPDDQEPGEPVSAKPAEAVSLGIVESRALIAAIRGGDQRVVASLTADFHAEGAREVLQDLSSSMGTGYRIKAFASAGRVLFARDWFGGPRGWLKMSVTLPRSEAGAPIAPTPQTITDDGRVTIRRTAAAGIRQDLLGLIAETLARPAAEPNGATDAR